MKKTLSISILLIVFLIVTFRICCGIFIIQPIGAIPQGATIVYLRIGTNLPFIASADGLLAETEAGVSLLGRGLLLASIAKPITDREIFRFGYSEWLYLQSTNGISFEK